MVIVDTRPGMDQRMYILTKSEIKSFGFSAVVPGDVVIIRRNMKVFSASDYFLFVYQERVSITKRYDIRSEEYLRLPKYILSLAEKIQLIIVA